VSKKNKFSEERESSKLLRKLRPAVARQVAGLKKESRFEHDSREGRPVKLEHRKD
jgi:hypothetical protein